MHFGPLSYKPADGRNFGGLGLMIDQPGVTVVVGPSRDGQVTKCHSQRAKQIFDVLKARVPWGQEPVEIDLVNEIPSHCGLGSGTQLSLALADALATLHGQRFPVTELAQLSGRGERSAIGLQGYEQGGFLIDAGRRSESEVGALATRLAFPEEWRILLVRTKEGQGLHGDFEINAFRNLRPMSEQVTGRLCRLALTEILPALHQQDLPAFNSALYEYGALVGTFFAGAQNGIFSCSLIRSLAARLPVEALGMAQSSWGPTVALFAENDAQARELWQRVKAAPEGPDLHIQLVQARNQGREVTRNPL